MLGHYLRHIDSRSHYSENKALLPVAFAGCCLPGPAVDIQVADMLMADMSMADMLMAVVTAG